VHDFGDVAIAQLVNTLTAVGPEHLRALEQLAASAPPQQGTARPERAGEPDAPRDED